MTGDLATRVRTIKQDYEYCFGCGLDNPMGLQIDDFSVDGDEVTATFTPRQDHRGFEGVLHGGIVATALDEMLAWTAILLEHVMVVTAKLELRYRNPAPVSTPYRLRGRLDERRGRRLLISGSCSTADDLLVAEASGLFLVSRELDL